MSVSLAELREAHSGILALIDEQTVNEQAEFDVKRFCRAVGRRLGRRLVLMPFDPADLDQNADASGCYHPSMGCGDTGFFSRVRDPRRPDVIRDVIGYASHESIPWPVQLGCIFHEIGHLVQNHVAQAAGEAEETERERLAQVFAPTLWEYGGRDAIRHIVGRSAFRSHQEREAEAFAVLLRERLATSQRRVVARAGGLANRMALPLLDPRGRGGA